MSDQLMPPLEGSAGPKTLEGWKTIAAYLNRDVRTAKRWEASEALPVHRHRHSARNSVYAYPVELDAWRLNRRPESPQQVSAAPRGGRRAVALAALVVVTLLSSGGGRVFGPTPAKAQDGSGGATLTQVWTGSAVSTTGRVCPDGRWLSTSWGGESMDLGVRELATGQTRVLVPATGDEYPEYSIFSRDCKQIAYAWRRQPGAYELKVVNVTGGEPRTVFATSGWLQPYDWSPDGSLIAAWIGQGRMNRLALVSTDGGGMRELETFGPRGVGGASFSGDGNYLVYETGGDLYSSHISGGERVALAAHPSLDSVLGWMPDGERLLFASDRSGTTDVYAIPVRGGRPVGEPQLLRSSVEIRAPMGVTSSGALVFARRTESYDIQTLTIDPASGRVVRPSTPLGGAFQGRRALGRWNPKGTGLGYFPGVQGAPTFYAHDAKTQQVRAVPIDLGSRGLAWAWLPHGRSLLLSGTDRERRGGLYLVEVETGKARRVLDEGPTGFALTVARDGRAAYMIRNRRLVRVELRHGTTTDLGPKDAVSLVMSPNGRLLATQEPLRDGTGAVAIRVASSAGGPGRDLATIKEDDPRALTWSPDSQFVYYLQRGELWRAAIDSGRTQRIELPPVPGANDVSVHPDGRQLAISTARIGSEVWRMDNISLAKPGE